MAYHVSVDELAPHELASAAEQGLAKGLAPLPCHAVQLHDLAFAVTHKIRPWVSATTTRTRVETGTKPGITEGRRAGEGPR